MPNVNDIFGSNDYVKAGDLPHSKSIPVVIESVVVMNFDDGAKLEIAFRGKQKRLICNKTNARSIATVLQTDEIEGWPGRTIFILRTKTDFQGRQVDCIRIDENPPVRSASQIDQSQPAQPAPQISPAEHQQRAANFDEAAATTPPEGADSIPF